MQQIQNGFCDYYYLTTDGKVFNSNTKRYLKKDNYNYILMTKDGKTKKITLKTLYKMVYNKIYCIDNIKSLQGEVWQQLPNNDNYYISNYGRVKSYAKYNAILLLQYSNEKGYKKVTMTENGTTKHKFVHILVAQTFLQQPTEEQEQYQVHHIDKNPSNNNVNNLMYLTIQEHYNIHNKQ